MLRILAVSIAFVAATLALAPVVHAAGAALVAPSLHAVTSPSSAAGVALAGYRRFYDDDYYDHVPPSYYAPRVYGYVQRYGYGPPPPAVYPPLYFYDWGPPPRPSSCGKYRYWDGEACVDARFRPPYVGPRW